MRISLLVQFHESAGPTVRTFAEYMGRNPHSYVKYEVTPLLPEGMALVTNVATGLEAILLPLGGGRHARFRLNS